MENSNAIFPFIEIEGPPFERGQQHGRQASTQIEKGIQLYTSLLLNSGFKWENICDEACNKFIPTIEAYNPAFLEEMRGIAQGAGVDLEAILLINARTEIVYGRKVPSKSDDLDDGCTTAIALGQATRNGHILQVQNWDWRQECLETAVIIKIKQDDAPDILTFVEAGGLARHGFNSNGIGVGANFLHTDQDYGRSGIPLSMIRRKILDSSLYYNALKAVTQTKKAFSNNMLVATADGEAISLEATPEEVFWVWPQDGLLVHSNHFLCPIARTKNKDLNAEEFPDTLYRHHRVDSFLRSRLGDITVDHMKEAFFDDFGSPYSVCRPPIDKRGDDALSMTVATIIMDLTDGVMWVCRAPYKNNQFTEYRMDMR